MFDYDDEEDRPIMDNRWGGEDDWKEQKRREREYQAAPRRSKNARTSNGKRGRPKSGS